MQEGKKDMRSKADKMSVGDLKTFGGRPRLLDFIGPTCSVRAATCATWLASPSSSIELAPLTDLCGERGPLEPRCAPEPVAPLIVRRIPVAGGAPMTLLCPAAPTAPLVAAMPDLLRTGAGPPSLQHTSQSGFAW